MHTYPSYPLLRIYKNNKSAITTVLDGIFFGDGNKLILPQDIERFIGKFNKMSIEITEKNRCDI